MESCKNMSGILLASSLESFIQLLGALIIFAVVLAATYLTTRWMGGMQKKTQSGKNLHVVESINIGANKTICQVEAGEIHLVVAVGKEEVHLLAELTKEQLKDTSFEQNTPSAIPDSFAEILNKWKDKLPKNKEKDE